jgi:hypothetical protein
MNAFNLALRALDQLRAGKAQPDRAEARPAAAQGPIVTNEPGSRHQPSCRAGYTSTP